MIENLPKNELCFQKIQHFDNSRFLYIHNIQILSKRGQVIAGSARHRDSGSLSECLNDIRLWNIKDGSLALQFGRNDEVISALSVSNDENFALTAVYSEDVITNRPMRL